MKVSRAMATQHPDNVSNPFFCDAAEMGGEDEIKEAFYSFSHVKCREQLWDCEGKEVDNFVVKKLLGKYGPFFGKNRLGKDVFLTLRVPNPSVEKSESKILLETLEGIPRNFDTAALFYGDADFSPIFEVALPMTTSGRELVRIAEYYRQHVVGKGASSVGGVRIGEWIGEFRPESIGVIPLVEDRDSILSCDSIVGEYLGSEKPSDYQRVWLARSDPALNYGNLATVLMLKVAFQRLAALQESSSVEILPILGCGSSPFRGNFRPDNVENCVNGYPSVQTFTLQSAFRYDHDIGVVNSAVDALNGTKRKPPVAVDEARCIEIVERLSAEYQRQVRLIAPLVNDFAQYVPSKRRRKLHIGLFGYSRSMGGVRLPRAIGFCASMYSLGLPPELLGLSAASEHDLEYVRSIYLNFDRDIADALQYLNPGNLDAFPDEIRHAVEKVAKVTECEASKSHMKVTGIILDDYRKGNYRVLSENIMRAGFIRKFLG
ncbi:phosphoenolpyruvate carboxylase [Candidatus Woesearchaeota archaeon]|nr:phosphoenolpyruvate carboxylase [Candidatus Woesearchaeota archaeon]